MKNIIKYINFLQGFSNYAMYHMETKEVFQINLYI